jgi:hypothetical protein
MFSDIMFASRCGWLRQSKHPNETEILRAEKCCIQVSIEIQALITLLARSYAIPKYATNLTGQPAKNK